MKTLIGGHLSVAGDINKALAEAREIGFNCLQIFSGPPRNWRSPRWSDQQKADFKKDCRKLRIEPVFIHAKYLINLAGLNEETVTKSRQSLIEDLIFANEIGSAGVIFHPHPRYVKQLVNNINLVLAATPNNTYLILENSAQSTIEEIANIVKLTQKSNRLKFCFDTAHAFEAGYDLRQTKVIDKVLNLIETEIGLNRWIAIHANDSRTKFESHHDQHADIGQGELGIIPFQYLLNHPVTKQLPYILETPAGKKEGLEGYKRNRERLLQLPNKMSGV